MIADIGPWHGRPRHVSLSGMVTVLLAVGLAALIVASVVLAVAALPRAGRGDEPEPERVLSA